MGVESLRRQVPRAVWSDLVPSAAKLRDLTDALFVPDQVVLPTASRQLTWSAGRKPQHITRLYIAILRKSVALRSRPPSDTSTWRFGSRKAPPRRPGCCC